jgi:hypothetical protein
MYQHAFCQLKLLLLSAVLLPLSLCALAAGAQPSLLPSPAPCSESCKKPANGTAVCMPSGVCVRQCDQGFVLAGTTCIRGGQGAYERFQAISMPYRMFLHVEQTSEDEHQAAYCMQAPAEGVQRYKVATVHSAC